MHNARFRVMAGLAGATLCLFAVAANGQNPTTTTPTGAAGAGAQAQTAQPTTPTDQAAPAPAPTTTDANGAVTSTATDVATTTTTTTRTFPGGMLGILAIAVLALLLLFGLFRGRDKTVVRDTYVSTPPVTRTVTTSTTADDRMNLNSRAASGPGTNPGAGMNDPNARR